MNTLTWRLLTAEELTRVYLKRCAGIFPRRSSNP